MRINPVRINPFSQVAHKQGQPIQFGEYIAMSKGHLLYLEQSDEYAARTNKLTESVQQLNTTLNTRLGELIQVLKPVNPPYKDV